jgi:hypothetical protein
VKNLMSALLKSNIKHDQRARFYQTLHRISLVLDRHFSPSQEFGRACEGKLLTASNVRQC